ncbi:receptor kinase-like protein Xa21 [Punica granatum]|uniref:Receptor kinase-like protein Xa21 n=1 Tax=Punica granatum TaxID=22663 RepID=A0A6P8D7I4_PUNGR|nr:receptor kinase-like protein Xa21 [Punica granatum]
MSNLLYFGIGANYLGREQANDLDFLRSLTNATNLYYLGSIPPEIGNLKKLKGLHLAQNMLTGEVPHTLGNVSMLFHLSMSKNNLLGTIPSSLSKCRSLSFLDLADNKLAGAIPPEIMSLSSLSIYADFSMNNLTGELPVEIGNLKHPSKLHLSGNKLAICLRGGVFATISATSVLENEKLCGGPPEYRLPKCKSTARSTNDRVRNVSIYTVSGILEIVFMLSLLCFLWHRKQRKTVASSSSNDLFLKVSYQDLLKATDGFSSANLIGTGSFGSVFKGVLALDQTTIAVKVLNLDRHAASTSFIKECDALKNIRHRNLVKVLTACSGTDYQGNDFTALVYEFMVNGSLDEWLHPRVGMSVEREVIPRQLGLLQRVNIATDVACALDYLHHQCETPMVHCDLKPSNVLIDGEMTGHIGDFGLVRFVPGAARELISELTSSIGVKGSLGYIAPGNYPNSS